MTNEQHIANLKKLKSFHIHNGNYDPDIDRAIKALEQEPCDDVISRQAVKELYYIDGYINFRKICELPSVNPQPKTGHWIEQIDHEENCRTLICSNCDRPALHDGDSIWKHKFCPHCGARMESEE